MPQADYEDRKQARIERLRASAEKAEEESQQTREQADNMARAIPFGQPILVGHHSEKRDRNYRNKIHNKFGKSIALQEKADHLTKRADAAESNRTISSDDPEALTKLQEKITKLEEERNRMKVFNRAWKTYEKGDDSKLKVLGLDDAGIQRMKTKIDNDYSWNKQPFASWQLSNLGATIRSAKQRLEHLSVQFNAVTNSETFGDVEIIENAEENRLQIVFPGKPDANIRSELKRRGFRWSPRNKAWQLHLTNAAKWKAHQVVEIYLKDKYQKENGLSFEDADFQLFPEVTPKIKKQCSLCLWAGAECKNKSMLKLSIDGECAAYTYYD